jgi:transaldolase
MDAYLAGLEDRTAKDLPVQHDRIGGFVLCLAGRFQDRPATLPEDSPLRGKAAIANAKLAYEAFESIFTSPRFATLKARFRARVQRPLWASTGTKESAYPDTLYVDELIGPDTVNTVPPATLDAFRDHGNAKLTITKRLDGAQKFSLTQSPRYFDEQRHARVGRGRRKVLCGFVQDFAGYYRRTTQECSRFHRPDG